MLTLVSNDSALEATIDGTPLTPTQKRAHVTLLIMAGADVSQAPPAPLSSLAH